MTITSFVHLYLSRLIGLSVLSWLVGGSIIILFARYPSLAKETYFLSIIIASVHPPTYLPTYLPTRYCHLFFSSICVPNLSIYHQRTYYLGMCLQPIYYMFLSYERVSNIPISLLLIYLLPFKVWVSYFLSSIYSSKCFFLKFYSNLFCQQLILSLSLFNTVEYLFSFLLSLDTSLHMTCFLHHQDNAKRDHHHQHAALLSATTFDFLVCKSVLF